MKNIKQNSLEKNIINCSSTSRWLKEQINLSENRDPVDAINDAEILIKVLEDRIKDINQDIKKTANQLYY